MAWLRPASPARCISISPINELRRVKRITRVEGVSDERAASCVAEYARLTREEGKKQNQKFEKDYAKLLEPYVAKYEKKSGNTPRI